ncbi:MAG: DUF5674 family protein [Candidatus Omnitrophica bacterium]|nr:DUF5674 family protein [Candidatus Omnitrophota bacterium]
MRIVKEKILLKELKEVARETFGELVKATVDVAKEIMVIGGELHSDQEALLLSEGSRQKDIWGINLYPEKYPQDSWLEFDSIINLRPSFGNKTCGVDDPNIRQKIIEIVNKLIVK